MVIKLLGNKSRGILFIISAPAGTGKSTLVEMILKEFPQEIAESCSCTTRLPRPGEIVKQHYEFISIEEFERMVANDEFLEYAKVFGNYYGTRKSEIERLQNAGKHVLLVIDTQGALKVKETISEGVFIFISPPSLEELRNRLLRRRTEDEEKIQERLFWAKKEMGMSTHYDYHIVNDNLIITYQILRSIFIAEEYKNLFKRRLDVTKKQLNK